MDPLSLGIGLGGLALQIFGGVKSASNAKEQAAVSQQISGYERDENNVRQQAMQLSARRQQVEIFRNAQRMRAAGINAAVNQGASGGSGLQGALSYNTSQALWNSQGVNQNLDLGQQMFGIDNQISGARVRSSQLQSQAATDNGIMSLGGAVLNFGAKNYGFMKGFGSGSNSGGYDAMNAYLFPGLQ